MKRLKPDDYEPPYPAFQAHPRQGHEQVVLAMLGVQAAPGADDDALLQSFRRLLCADAPGRPLHVECGWHVDTAGHRNDVLLPYWHTAADMHAFWSRDDVRAVLAKPLHGPVGWWRETLCAPTTSLDANYSIPDARYGIGRYSEMRLERFHAYFGSMRDRVPDFHAGRADGAAGQLERREPVASRGRRLRIVDVPDKLCFIRAAFAWEAAAAEEQRVFRDEMYPVYREGSDYLSAHPLESNCISMRMIDEQREDYDNGVQSESLGWFLTLADLERWTHHHPRHHAIMKNIMAYMQRFDFKPRLNLGHEVLVVPAGQAEFEYSNCHPGTGFLPFFAAVEA